MIAFLKGHFVNKTPANVIVDVQGIGYDVQISLNTFSAISQLESGLLYTHLHITENAHTLFGFATNNEKLLFLQLISVSGVGASTARMMLSGLQPEELIKAIVQSNTLQLEKIKGIGKKTAERIVLELKDKLVKLYDMNVSAGVGATQSMDSDAVDALMALGIAKPLAENAVKRTMKALGENSISLEDLIKNALKNL